MALIKDLEKIILFLKSQTENWKNAFFSADISQLAENNVRSEFLIGSDEKILALINEAFLEQNVGKSGYIFTDKKIYIKQPFSEVNSLFYDELPDTPFSFFRENVPVRESCSGKDMVSLFQKIKIIAMYGEADHIKPPSDPAKSIHPVKDWFVFAVSFILFILLVPWILLCVVGPKTSFPSLVKYLSMISILSWLVWFHSHRAKIKKNKSIFSIVKKILYGVVFSSGFLATFFFDKTRSNPGWTFSSLFPLLFVSFIGSVICIFLFLLMGRLFHQAGNKVKRKKVLEEYLEKSEKENKNTLSNLLEAGVSDLDDDTEIRKVCYDIANTSINPLKEYWETLENADLFEFFKYANERGYDFDKWGKPEDIVNRIRAL